MSFEVEAVAFDWSLAVEPDSTAQHSGALRTHEQHAEQLLAVNLEHLHLVAASESTLCLDVYEFEAFPVCPFDGQKLPALERVFVVGAH